MSSSNPLLYLPQFSSPNPSILDLERLSKRYPKVSRPLFLLNALLILLLLFKISYCFNALRLAPECYVNSEGEKEKRALNEKSHINDQNNNDKMNKKEEWVKFSLNDDNIFSSKSRKANKFIDELSIQTNLNPILNEREIINRNISNEIAYIPINNFNMTRNLDNNLMSSNISKTVPLLQAVINSQSQSTPSELVLPVIAGILWFIASFILAVGVQRRILKCLEFYLLLVVIVFFLELLAGFILFFLFLCNFSFFILII